MSLIFNALHRRVATRHTVWLANIDLVGLLFARGGGGRRLRGELHLQFIHGHKIYSKGNPENLAARDEQPAPSTGTEAPAPTPEPQEPGSHGEPDAPTTPEP